MNLKESLEKSNNSHEKNNFYTLTSCIHIYLMNHMKTCLAKTVVIEIVMLIHSQLLSKYFDNINGRTLYKTIQNYFNSTGSDGEAI